MKSAIQHAHLLAEIAQRLGTTEEAQQLQEIAEQLLAEPPLVLTSGQIAQLYDFAGVEDQTPLEDQARYAVTYAENGHSGPGLYVHMEDHPDEGAIHLDGIMPGGENRASGARPEVLPRLVAHRMIAKDGEDAKLWLDGDPTDDFLALAGGCGYAIELAYASPDLRYGEWTIGEELIKTHALVGVNVWSKDGAEWKSFYTLTPTEFATMIDVHSGDGFPLERKA